VWTEEDVAVKTSDDGWVWVLYLMRLVDEGGSLYPGFMEEGLLYPGLVEEEEEVLYRILVQVEGSSILGVRLGLGLGLKSRTSRFEYETGLWRLEIDFGFEYDGTWRIGPMRWDERGLTRSTENSPLE